MTDHEEIEAAAADLLANAVRISVDSDTLFRQLQRLADKVEAHIAAEDIVVRNVESKDLHGLWRDTWIEGRRVFDKLRADWIGFLDRWLVQKITEQRSRFAFECRAILGRINERLQKETQSFYATALQFGSIALR